MQHKNTEFIIKRNKFLLFFSLIFISLYIPFFFSAYSNFWYEFNFENQNTYQKIGLEKATNASNNLVEFFLHKQELNSLWNEKEKIHMKDVRNIYDFLFVVFILNIIFLIRLFNKKKVKEYAKKNIIIITCLTLLIPMFNFFWTKIFHSVLFSNNYWILTPNDISYYLFPIDFFINSLILIIAIGVFFNLIFYT